MNAHARWEDRAAVENGRRRERSVAGKKTALFGSAAIGTPAPIDGFQNGDAPSRIACANAARSGAKKKPRSRA